jgi:hypothetical protein
MRHLAGQCVLGTQVRYVPSALPVVLTVMSSHLHEECEILTNHGASGQKKATVAQHIVIFGKGRPLNYLSLCFELREG